MLGDDTRKPNRLTLTPEQLLTPDALHEAGDAEEALEDGEASENELEAAGFAQKPAVILDCETLLQRRQNRGSSRPGSVRRPQDILDCETLLQRRRNRGSSRPGSVRRSQVILDCETLLQGRRNRAAPSRTGLARKPTDILDCDSRR